MNKIKIFLILLVLFISISAVSAEGNFTALQNEIDTSDNSIDIQQDYKYDNLADNGLENGILINKSDFTVNGNGYTIDGSNQARIFNITGNNVTILNLKLINGNFKDGAAIYTGSAIILNNVSFINNNATKGAIFGNGGSQIISNCYFENNTGIYAGSIYYNFVKANIINSTFTNTTSKYAPAIYKQGPSKFTIQDCTFKNLYAKEGSGGAIGMKVIGEFEIDNCTFINTTSYKNGGAIFIDFPGNDGVNGNVKIKKSRFFNTTGNIGGALAILEGTIVLEDCEFCDNAALYYGGAIYISEGSMKINNTLFYRNKLYYDDSLGGGIYIDYSGNYLIENCEFINNTKQGIYAYDIRSGLNVKDTTFLNNTEAIHAVFTKCNLTNVNFGNDTRCLNDTDYASNVHEIAKSITLINNTLDVVTLPSRYDSRDWGWVSPVKNQGTMGSCWTFGNCGALESALLKATGIEYDFSENNMQDSMIRYSKYGIIDAVEGGVVKEQGLEYVLSWFGVMPSEYDPYDELGKLSPLIFNDEKIHIFDAIFIGLRKNSTDNDELKRAIIRCGSVAAGFHYDHTNENIFNKENGACYQTDLNTTNHMVSIVGWDDNYPKENFVITPPGDGAFIIKNSHGTEMGDHGYLYLSYYDPSLLNTSIAIGYIIENTENYTTNYQTDLGGHRDIITKDRDILSYKNSYQSGGPELISAVGTYFEPDENYTLEIYVNDELIHTQSGIAPFYGYHTVKLTTEIPITTGDNFTALMKKASISIFTKSRQHYRENV
ncbi:MAG: right-handed parallel beta-helix repeat-containing protein, partial [Methanobrevibacter sp.]|nr:right-handed parallel beta-helix repeat-containing protein [Methanobrevibacter sp.]